MKRIFKFIISLLIISCCTFSVFSLTEEEEYRKENIIASIDGVHAPKIVEDFLVFTASKEYRYVGIAFDYEDYKIVHPFFRNIFYDIDLKPRDSILFYVCKIPEKTKEISYRLVIDGVWTTDPVNPVKYYDYDADTYLSKVQITNPEVFKTENLPSDIGQQKNYTRFVYQGESGQTIRLGGTFTNWDSFIYELEETSEGFYELSICLPPGTYYYVYYNGSKSFIDKSNPHKAFTADGKIASILEVN